MMNDFTPEFQTLITFDKASFYEFNNKKKSLKSTGKCEVQTLKNSNISLDKKIYEIKIGSFTQNFSSSNSFLKAQYSKSAAYFYEKDSTIWAFSVKKDQPELQKFDLLLKSFASVSSFNEDNVNPTLNQKMKEHCSDKIQTHDFSKDPKQKVKVVGQSIGGVLGAVNALAVKPINKVGGFVHDKTYKFKDQKVSEQTKQKWNNVKEKSNSFNEKLTNLIEPAVTGYYNLSNKVGEKVYDSENVVIKAVRDYSLAFARGLSTGEFTARYPNQQQSQAPKQAIDNFRSEDQFKS